MGLYILLAYYGNFEQVTIIRKEDSTPLFFNCEEDAVKYKEDKRCYRFKVVALED